MADITFMKTPAETKLGEQFLTLYDAQPALAPRRAEAFKLFAEKGLPHRRNEAWHYTDLRSLLRDALPPAPAPTDAAVSKARAWLERTPAPGFRVVVLDGAYRADLSMVDGLPEGVTLASTLDVMGQGSASPANDLLAADKVGTGESILALNAAFVQGGAVLTVAEGVALDRPVDLVHFVSGDAPMAVATRSLVHLGAGASATVLERHVSLGPAASQGNHAIVEGAALDPVADVQDFPAEAMHLGSCLARLGADARLASFTMAATPGVTRRQSFVEFTGPGSNISLRGVTLLSGRAHSDTTLVVTHSAPHCESREYYKTILDGDSTGVYQGKVVVAPGAQKTDGKMLSKAVFLGDGPSMYNKPELEIFADDVVCGHGATVGYLDEDQLFYLRARGIPFKEAQSLLLNAFAADAIEGVATEAVRDELTGSIEQWLRKRQS